MIDQSKRFFLGCIFILMIVIHIAARHEESGAIDLLLESTTEINIKEGLKNFIKGGIQKNINLQSYDVEEVIAFAELAIGTPHRMGGSTLQGIDCSGLVMLAHSKAEIALPHGSQDQARYGRILYPDEELKRGDLVFFHSTYRTAKLVTHSGIYLGDGKFIHTSSSRGVVISELKDNGYYERHYLFATRLVD